MHIAGVSLLIISYAMNRFPFPISFSSIDTLTSSNKADKYMNVIGHTYLSINLMPLLFQVIKSVYK